MKAYSGLASIYDELMHEDVDYKNWINFIKQRLPKDKCDILELACGTGNITIGLAKDGHKMTGVDISEEMLSIAAEKESRYKIKWINQDIQSLNLKGDFDCVLCPCDGFNYITSIEELSGIIKNVYKYLREGGSFIFDLSSLYKLENILGNNTFAESHDDMAYIWENYYDDISGICEFEVTIFERDGDKFRKTVEYHKQKAYEANDIMFMLSRIGFKDIKIYNDYDSQKEGLECAERIVFTCSK